MKLSYVLNFYKQHYEITEYAEKEYFTYIK